MNLKSQFHTRLKSRVPLRNYYGVEVIKFSSLKEKINMYFQIGKYIGCDAGDYHLMLSVGGQCKTIIPEVELMGYNYFELLYPLEFTQGKLEYIKRNELSKIYENCHWI